MHSHSGQFCPGHAKDQLEDILLHAISLGFTTFAFTEHMPRYSAEDLYPEETPENTTPAEALALLPPRHEAYLLEAQSLRSKYKNQIEIIIGFESEFITPAYISYIRTLFSSPAVDFYIGSLHHVHGIPIDYDTTLYNNARNVSGSDVQLFGDYFDEQAVLIREMQPRVVGHFDLIRLWSGVKDGWEVQKGEGWDVLWGKIRRNLILVVQSGGLLEINSAALRKGLKEPYPGRGVCEEFLKLGGKLTLSDDSHGIEQEEMRA
ncbi:hypothetical protein B7494_g120 [Chlorociboria aeruginascens]|nr:hypothetical protein B7494_g120 [Chlorociboria aeruginascens]